MIKTSLVIPNWNGQKILEKNLPSVLAIKPDEIIVVDDASSDDSVSFLKKKHPQIRILKHSVNMGFAVSANDGVKHSQGEIVILLNSDVVPEKDLLLYSLPYFDDPKVFAVSFHEPQWSWARIYWKNGFMEHEPGLKSEKTHLAAWANGGSSAFRKSAWDELSGFDRLYHPFYWEDIDLSYRAWKRGFRILWEPKSIVHHRHEGTIGKHFSKNYINFISERNRLLFIWKNIDSTQMILEHKFNLGKKLLIHPSYWSVFLSALTKIPQILPKRFSKSKNELSDQEIFELFKVA